MDGTANNPTVLTTDEPTTALDVTIQRKFLIWKELKDREACACCFITHESGIVRAFATASADETGGSFEPRPQRDFREPAHPYTMQAAGAEPMAAPTLCPQDAMSRRQHRPSEVGSDPEGVMAQDGGSREGGQRALLCCAAGRDLGHVGEFGSAKNGWHAIMR